MDITLYNTLSRRKEAFEPLLKGRVSMYNCGPTVYDTPHIGNYRTFIMNDLLRRMFEYSGYAVDQTMNITDVDDKTIRRNREQGLSLSDLTRKYEKLFYEGIESVNILPPQHILRATENIPTMIELISDLLAKGAAYKADDGIYMSVSKVIDYGRLAGLDASRISKERITNDEYDKDDPHDFALWKFRSDADGDAHWSAPFGEGRPGWHIECSAMSMKVFGPTMDVHTGASDLIFPHHTNEIAQSESSTGEQFVHYWVHAGFMNVNDEKMAKSKGNFVKLETLADEAISPLAFRYWALTAHYRSPVNFTFEAVHAAQNALVKLIKTAGSYPDGGTIDAGYQEKFAAAIADDLDMPKAVALAWELIKDAKVSDADKRATLLDFDRVFGLKLESAPRAAEPAAIPDEIKALADAREEARKAKDWEKADALRAEIESRGYAISDSAEGIRIESRD